MADTFHARILTPDDTVFEGEVYGLQVPGVEGSFEMRTGHAPIISNLAVGQVQIQKPDASLEYFAVGGGFVEMSNNRATVMAEAAESVDEIDADRALRAKERALDRIRRQEGNMDVMYQALKRAENRLKLIEEYL